MKRIFELEKEHEAMAFVTTSSAQAPTHPLTRSDIPVTIKVSLVFSCQSKYSTRTIIVGLKAILHLLLLIIKGIRVWTTTPFKRKTLTRKLECLGAPLLDLS